MNKCSISENWTMEKWLFTEQTYIHCTLTVVSWENKTNLWYLLVFFVSAICFLFDTCPFEVGQQLCKYIFTNCWLYTLTFRMVYRHYQDEIVYLAFFFLFLFSQNDVDKVVTRWHDRVFMFPVLFHTWVWFTINNLEFRMKGSFPNWGHFYCPWWRQIKLHSVRGVSLCISIKKLKFVLKALLIELVH